MCVAISVFGGFLYIFLKNMLFYRKKSICHMQLSLGENVQMGRNSAVNFTNIKHLKLWLMFETLFFNEFCLNVLFLYTFLRHLNKLICLKKGKETILYLAYIDISFVLHCLTPLSPLILHYFMVMALAETIQYFKFMFFHLSQKNLRKKLRKISDNF